MRGCLWAVARLHETGGRNAASAKSGEEANIRGEISALCDMGISEMHCIYRAKAVAGSIPLGGC